MKYMSLTAARGTTSRFFADSGVDQLPIEQIYTNVGRDLSQVDANKKWLTNKLTHLKHYNLAEPVYTTTRPRRLIAVRLTHQGKVELGMTVSEQAHAPVAAAAETFTAAPSQPVQQTMPIAGQYHESIKEIYRRIFRYEEENPGVELDLVIKEHGKEVPMQQLHVR